VLAAVRLCRCEFLEGFEVPGAPLFDAWLVGRRAAVRADMLAVMDRAVTLARDGSQPGSTDKTWLKTWWGSHRPFASWSFL
jgi:hypothetical protein